MLSPLVAENTALTAYHGFLQVHEREYRVRIDMEKCTFECEEELKGLLYEYEAVVLQRLSQSKTIHDFVTELTEIVERVLRDSKGVVAPPCNFYERLISEMELLGWDKLISMNQDLSEIQLSLIDKNNRKHSLHVRFPLHYPEVAPKCTAELPVNITLDWNNQFKLNNVIVQYMTAFESWDSFWLVMEDFDEHCWVLDSADYQSLSSCSRRIAVAKASSLQIDIDCNRPFSIPTCRFLGATHSREKLRSKFNTNLHLWNESKTPRQNMENILEITFPTREDSKKEDFGIECGICYAYKQDQGIPDRLCENSSCSKPFHKTCLLEWLRALPNTRQSFNTMFGKCPYCSFSISVSSSIQ